MLLRAVLNFLLLPGLFAGVAPWLLAAGDPWQRPGLLVGALPFGAGWALVVWCVRDFYVAGRGTLAPWAPPQRLVVVGAYRYVRNPMYVGALGVIGGTALLAGSPVVAAYALVAAVAFHLRIVLYEEPHLGQLFPADWARYRAAVPRWRPRLNPWHG